MDKYWIAGVLSGFALALVLTGCEAKKDETSQAPADQPRSMANPMETRDAPIAPAPQATERPGAAGQQ